MKPDPRFFAALLCIVVACSDEAADDARCETCGLDAARPPGETAERMDASRAPERRPFFDDAGSSALRAQLQVNGATSACGSCSVLIAQAQGGRAPYEYTWSDPSLQGPGPHRVCPDAPTSYSVIVRDTASGEGEFQVPSESVEAIGDVRCTAPDADGGVQGCWTASPAGGDAGPPSTMCGDPNDAGITFDLTTGALGTVKVSTELGEKAFRAGQTYEYSHDRLVPITLSLGEAVTVDVFGADEPCGEQEKLFTLTYDLFTWHQSFCFTPTRDFRYLVIAVHLNGALFSWEFLAAGTTCGGCSMQP